MVQEVSFRACVKKLNSYCVLSVRGLPFDFLLDFQSQVFCLRAGGTMLWLTLRHEFISINSTHREQKNTQCQNK